MKTIKVGAASLNQTPLDWKGNVARILDTLKKASNQRVQLLCLPELCITGYGCEDFFWSTDVQDMAMASLKEIVRGSPVDLLFCVGLPMAYNNALYNVVAFANNNCILGFVAKQHLAGDGLHYEQRWFKPWPAGVVRKVNGIPFGDVQFDLDGVKIGFEICEDAFVANRPGSSLSRKGVDIILNPSASHFAIGKYKTRRSLVTEGARAFKVSYIYANLLGNEAGRVIYGGECIIAGGPDGSILRESPPFSMDPAGNLITAVLDVDTTRTQQIGSASFSPDYETEYYVSGQFLTPTKEAISQPIKVTDYSPEYEFEQAATLGLWDYLRKSGSKGFVISLSGGADSAACAYLVWKTLNRVRTERGTVAIEDVTKGPHNSRHFLTCVYQATKNSSSTTLDAAQAVAQDLGAKFLSIDVEELTQSYLSIVGKAEGHTFNWEGDDLVMQNIQARVRAPSTWLLANYENKLLITTSNRSEAAVGYCTMDGDTAGSISPIGGVSKEFIIKWLNQLNSEEFPSILKILRQKPTAELRPGNTQTDEDDLMPYEVLDFIEGLAIQQKMGPKSAYKMVSEKYHQHTPKEAFEFVHKFYTLFCRNQWKRERYAPALNLGSRNLDPRSWCRFPILSSGFRGELEELAKSLAL